MYLHPMKRKPILLKILAVFLTLSIGLPGGLAAHPELVEGERPGLDSLRQAGLEQNAAKQEFVDALGHSAPAAGMEEDLAGELMRQTLRLLDELLEGPKRSGVTAEDLKLLQIRFDSAPEHEKREFLKRLWQIYQPTLQKMAAQRVESAAPAASMDDRSGRTPPAILVAGPAVNLNLNVSWKPKPGSHELEVDLAGTSLKANGSPTNVMETLKLLGAPFRSIGVRSVDEQPVSRLFLQLLQAAGINPGDWPAVSADTDFVPTLSSGELDLDIRFIPAAANWTSAEIEGYVGAVRQIAQEMDPANHNNVLAITSRMPANAPPDYLPRLFRIGKEKGMFVVYDPKSATLQSPGILEAIAKESPHLITPNLEEFSLLAGKPPGEWIDRNPAALIQAAREWLEKSTLQMILISLDKDGALLVDKTRVVYANVEPGLSVLGPGGAGDAGLANLLHRYTQSGKIKGSFSELTDTDFAALLQAYVAGGAAAVQMPGDESPSAGAVREMERRVHTKLFKNVTQTQLFRFRNFDDLHARADAPYPDQVWVPRLERFFYSDPAVLSADNAGSDLYLEFILSQPDRFKNKEVLDPVTGSGVLAAALALAGARHVVATDISPDAVRLARANLQEIPEIRSRVTVGVSDVYDNLSNITGIRRFHAIVANNPTMRKNPVAGRSETYEANAGVGFEVPQKLLSRMDALLVPDGDGLYMTTRDVEEEDPPRRLTAGYLRKLLPLGWLLEPTGFKAMGRSEHVPLMIQHISRPAAGAEELPPGFEYQSVRAVWSFRLRDEDRGRVLRNSHGQKFLVKQRGSWKEISENAKRWLWPMRNDPYREYIAFRLARIAGANVADVVIPSDEERAVLARRFGGQADDLYLVRLADDYKLADKEISQKDSRKAFTRFLGVSILMRKWDLHSFNEAPLSDTREPLLWFDHDVAFHPMLDIPPYVTELWVFTNLLKRNYFSSNPNTVGGEFDLDELTRRLDMDELAQTVLDIENLNLRVLRNEIEQALSSDRLISVEPYVSFLEEKQKTFRSDAQSFLRELISVRPDQQILNPRDLERDFLDAVERQFNRPPAAGATESRIVSVTRYFARENQEALARVDAGDTQWEREGTWEPVRFVQDIRPWTGSPLRRLWELSYASVAGGEPVAYIYATDGQDDFPVADRYPGLFVYRISTRKDYQRQGQASRLIYASVSKAKELGIGPYVTLLTRTDNGNAQGFYESLGFRKEGVWSDPRKGGAFIEYVADREELLSLLEKKLLPPAAGVEELPMVDMTEYEVLVPREKASQAVVYKHKSRDEVLKEFIVKGVQEQHLVRYVAAVGRLRKALDNPDVQIAPVDLVRGTDGVLRVRMPFIQGQSLAALYGEYGPERFSPESDQEKEYVRLFRVAHLLLKQIGPLADYHGSMVSSLENFQVPKIFLRGGNLKPEEYGKISLVNIDPLNMLFLRAEMEEEDVTAAGAEEGAAELRERMDGYRSAVQEPGIVVLGRSLAERFPGLQVLAGLEERVVIDRGDPVDTAIRLAESGVRLVQYFGGLEEATDFKRAAQLLQIDVMVDTPENPQFRSLLAGILRGLGVPLDVMNAGLEEFYEGLEQLGEAA